MQLATVFVFATCAVVGPLQSQVLAPAEIRDEGARSLQEKYFNDLKAVANSVKSLNFPYRFFFSRVMDVSEERQQSTDQRSLQFDRFEGKLILKITGNYFASYSADVMEGPQRARQTFTDVMLPILREAVPRFPESDVPASFALEISHHVRKRVLGVLTEGAENVVLVLPKQAATDLVTAQDSGQQTAALLRATAFLDGKPVTFWPEETATVKPNAPVAPLRSESLPPQPSPGLERMIRELDPQAHFVKYAEPTFIDFHHRRFLQLSVTTSLTEQNGGSQYRLAALAFDKHIAQLIRPVLVYLKDARDFDGIDFSTTIHTSKDEPSGSNLSVEYLFPLDSLRNYEAYDTTGQQLIDSAFVLVNGERITLNLQTAEDR